MSVQLKVTTLNHCTRLNQVVVNLCSGLRPLLRYSSKHVTRTFRCRRHEQPVRPDGGRRRLREQRRSWPVRNALACEMQFKLFSKIAPVFSTPPSQQSYRYFDVAMRLAWSRVPESYAGGSVATCRASLVGQVTGDDPGNIGYAGPPGWVLGLGLTTPLSTHITVTHSQAGGQVPPRDVVPKEEQDLIPVKCRYRRQ